MSEPPSRPPLDDDTIAFAGRVFDLARGGFASELSDLLGQGVPANLTNGKGDTLLILACYHGHEEAARVLLEAGADAERVNDRGQTSLAAAAFKGALPVMALLLERGAAVDGRGPDGRTALMVAAMFDRVDAVDLLLRHGADPKHRDVSGLDAAAAADKMGAENTGRRIAEARAAGRP